MFASSKNLVLVVMMAVIVFCSLAVNAFPGSINVVQGCQNDNPNNAAAGVCEERPYYWRY